MEIHAGITILDTISYIMTCLQYLKSLKDCPLLVLTTCTNIDLDKKTDVILQCLQSNFNLMNALQKASLNEIFFQLITGIIEVMNDKCRITLRVIYPTFQHPW